MDFHLEMHWEIAMTDSCSAKCSEWQKMESRRGFHLDVRWEIETTGSCSGNCSECLTKETCWGFHLDERWEIETKGSYSGKTKAVVSLVRSLKKKYCNSRIKI